MSADKSHENNFDLIRMVLAILVILSHAYGSMRLDDPMQRFFHTVSFGEFAVDCFFILSGFLITRSWEHSPSMPMFLRNRVLRIYPGFILAFFVTVFIVGPIGAMNWHSYFHHLHPVTLLTSAAALKSPVTPSSFPNSTDPMLNKAMWTVHIEFACYMLLLALGVLKILHQRWLVILLFAAALVSFIVFRHSGENAAHAGAIYGDMGVSVLRFLPMFLAGAVMYKTGWYHIRPRWLIAGAALALGAGLGNRFIAEPAIATAGAYLMMVAGTADVMPKSVRKMPDISYGIYLYGSPGLKLAGLVSFLARPEEIFVLALMFAAAMAYVSWSAIEYPAMKLKKMKFMMNFSRIAEVKETGSG